MLYGVGCYFTEGLTWIGSLVSFCLCNFLRSCDVRQGLRKENVTILTIFMYPPHTKGVNVRFVSAKFTFTSLFQSVASFHTAQVNFHTELENSPNEQIILQFTFGIKIPTYCSSVSSHGTCRWANLQKKNTRKNSFTYIKTSKLSIKWKLSPYSS